MSCDCYCACLKNLIVKVTHLQHCTVAGLIIEFVMFSVSIECFKHIIAVSPHSEAFGITFVLVWLVLRFHVFLHYFAKQSFSCASMVRWSNQNGLIKMVWSRLQTFYD